MTESASSVSEPVEAIIIGGGPAGAAAARLLSRWGHSVLLLTRPSGLGGLAESIPPSCRKLFDQIGIAEAIDGAPFMHTRGNTIWWGGEERTVVFESAVYGYQVARARFDQLLLEQAAGAGVQVHRNATVRAVAEPDESGRAVRYETGVGPRTAIARWVLDCSGRAGVIARAWRKAEPGQRTLALIGSWEREDGWPLRDETHTLVESYDAGWAWSVPVSDARRCVAVMVDPALTAPRGRTELAALYHAELARTRWLSALTAHADVIEEPWACDASAYSSVRVSADGVLLVGDAASFVDPLSSFGIKKALASAWLAAVVAHTCLMQPDLQSAALQLYEARESNMYRSLQTASAQLARIAASNHAHEFWLERTSTDASPALGEPDIAALRNDPAVLAAFDAIRGAESLRLRASTSFQRIDLPIVRGNRIALAAHITNPSFPHGIRYVRDVDLLKLADLASEFGQVPDLYEAYNRSAPPVALPDFLGALSMLVAKGVLEPA